MRRELDGQHLPPVNANSALLAAQPAEAVVGSSSLDTTPLEDTSDLYTALTRSHSSMRRAISAPHSMDLYLLQLQHQQAQATVQHAQPPPPQGGEAAGAMSGPMRRVASSLGMRRSNSFLWTPAAHNDFERAIGFLSARGVEVSATAIAHLMRQRHADLKEGDVDKHLRRKFAIQHRMLQQLQRGPEYPAAPSSWPAEAATGHTPQVDAACAGVGGSLTGMMSAVHEEPNPPISLSEQLDQQRAAHQQMMAMRQQMLANEHDT